MGLCHDTNIVLIMNTEIISLIVALLGLVTAAGYSLLIFRFKKKIERRLKENGAKLDYRRELAENEMDKILSNYISDGETFSDMYHMLVYSPGNLKTSKKVPNDSFYLALGIDMSNIEVMDNSVACLMPFNKKYEKTFGQIKSVCEELGLICRRSDEEFVPNQQVLPQIVKIILESEVVVAVLNGRNPNVFYEIGIAHSVGKPVLLLSDLSRQEDTAIPFDIQSVYSIVYNNPLELRDELKKRISSITHE